MRQSSPGTGFDNLMKDTVILVKQSGERIEGIKASVQGDRIYMGGEWPAQDGDTILRPVPYGIETYTILDTGYHPTIGGIPANFQMKVRKETAIRDERAASTVNTYNLHGANSRVNISSSDYSVNTVNSSTTDLFADMRQVILTKIEAEQERAPIIEAINEMEQNVGQPGFIQKYQNFMQSAANHVTTLAPFLPLLSKLLGS